MPFTRPWDVTTVLTPIEKEATERTTEGLVLIVLGPTHTKPKLINRVGSANEEEELKTKNQRNKQTRGGDILWGIRVDAP